MAVGCELGTCFWASFMFRFRIIVLLRSLSIRFFRLLTFLVLAVIVCYVDVVASLLVAPATLAALTTIYWWFESTSCDFLYFSISELLSNVVPFISLKP